MDVRCTLALDASSASRGFQCTAGSKNIQTFAVDVVPDAKARALDAMLAKNQPPKDVCKIAEACGVDTYALSKETFRPDVELGVPRTPQKCQRTLEALRVVAHTMGHEVPSSCK